MMESEATSRTNPAGRAGIGLVKRGVMLASMVLAGALDLMVTLAVFRETHRQAAEDLSRQLVPTG